MYTPITGECRIRVYNGRIHTVPLDSPSLGYLGEGIKWASATTTTTLLLLPLMHKEVL